MNSEPTAGLSHRRRACFTFGLLIGALFLLAARLIQIQAVEAHFYRRQVERQAVRKEPLPAPRGTITDRQGVPLAISVPAESLCAYLPEVGDEKARQHAAAKLAPILSLSEEVLWQKLTPRYHLTADGKRRMMQRWVILADGLSEEQALRLRPLKLRGFHFEPTAWRLYPHEEIACHVLGFSSPDGRGREGLELALDRQLTGAEGYVLHWADGTRRAISTERSRFVPPRQGEQVILTLDLALQHIVEDELARAVEKFRPQGATAILMDPWSGDIMALANYPAYDLNEYGRFPPECRRNRAITDQYEPGSTFKSFVLSSAICFGKVHPGQMIDCEKGAWRVRKGRTLHDCHAYGKLPIEAVLVFSSNIGAAKVGLLAGNELLFRELQRWGFGRPAGIELCGEAGGMLRPYRRWNADSTISISIGQEIAVTPLQLIVGYCAIANGGVRLQPHLVYRRIGPEGRETYCRKVTPVCRVLTPSAAAWIQRNLHRVVIEGTGKGLWMREYSLAGKTGTAQKVDDGQYSHTKYVGSFCGFAPVERPRLVCLVALDEPQGAHYGATVAGPAVREILRRALAHLGIPPCQEATRPPPAFQHR